ncbi:MAG TPA: hypothetical protein VJH34_00490 [archaeon]|nr:hypothetical protein [archaeon]
MTTNLPALYLKVQDEINSYGKRDRRNKTITRENMFHMSELREMYYKAVNFKSYLNNFALTAIASAIMAPLDYLFYSASEDLTEPAYPVLFIAMSALTFLTTFMGAYSYRGMRRERKYLMKKIEGINRSNFRGIVKEMMKNYKEYDRILTMRENVDERIKEK